MNYHPNRNGRPVAAGRRNRAEEFFISRRMIDVPLSSDGGVIMLQPNPEKPNTEQATYPDTVRYGRLDDLVAGKSRADWLATMVKTPNLAVLRKLLAESKQKYPPPAALLKDERPGAAPRGSANRRGRDRVDRRGRLHHRRGTCVASERSARCRERPIETAGIAYIFDSKGTLLAALGGELGRTSPTIPTTWSS